MIRNTGEPGGRLGRGVRMAREILRPTDTPGIARRAAAVALIIRLANAVLAYAAQVVLARLMGAFEYGVFAYTWVWFLVFGSVAALGFSDSPLRYIAHLRARGEDAELRGFLRFAPVAAIVGSLVFGLVLIALLPVAGRWIESAHIVPMIMMAICLPFAGLQAVLEVYGRSYNWTVPALLPVYVLRHGLLLIFMIAAVELGFAADAVTAFLCLIVTLVVSTLYQAVAILGRLRRVVPAGPRAYRPSEWVRGSLPFAAIYAAQHVASFADVLVLSFFAHPDEIAVYFAATRIVHVVNLVPYAATVGTAHLFSASHSLGNHDDLQRLCRQVTWVTAVLCLGALAMIIAFGGWLLHMFGERFEAGYIPLVILAVGVMLRVATGPAEDVLNMTGYSGVTVSSYLVTIPLNIVLAVALIIPFGANGAATATGIALIVRGIWLTIAARKRLGVDTTLLTMLPQRNLIGRAQAPAE